MDYANDERLDTGEDAAPFGLEEALRLSRVAFPFVGGSPTRMLPPVRRHRPVFVLETTMPVSFLSGGFEVATSGRRVSIELDGPSTGGCGHVAMTLSSHDVSGEFKGYGRLGRTGPAIGSHAFVRALLGRRVRVTVEAVD